MKVCCGGMNNKNSFRELKHNWRSACFSKKDSSFRNFFKLRNESGNVLNCSQAIFSISVIDAYKECWAEIRIKQNCSGFR